ncbi:hypothetical protein L208DRAFT_1403678, partial [Tricholoma matsutake]
MCEGMEAGILTDGSKRSGQKDTFGDPKGQPEGSSILLGPRGTPDVNRGGSGEGTKIQQVRVRNNTGRS